MWKTKKRPSFLAFTGNAWNGEYTGINGLSNVVDTKESCNISVFGRTSESSEILFLVSADGINFFHSRDLSEIINTEAVEVKIINIAEPPSGFTASQTNTGSPQNLAESNSVEELWRVNVGGTLAEDLWVRFDAGEEKEINSYGLMSSSSRNAPKSWKLQGSNDNSSWTDIDERSEEVFIENLESAFGLEQPETYRYFRLLITEGGDEGPGITRTQLNMFRLFQVEEDENGEDANFSFHMKTTIGARYVRLLSKQNVKATITIAYKE